MSDVRVQNQLRSLHIRAKVPQYFRVAAIGVFALTLIIIGIGYFRAKSNAEFRMASFPAGLSKDIVASVAGYERHESNGEQLLYYIKADSATTYSDNHQELENVYLQVFGDDGVFDEITAQKAVYVPETEKNFNGYFAGDVVIKTRDQLQVRTQQVAYAKATETATADERVEFERHNIKGYAFGSSVQTAAKRITLNKDVNVEITTDSEHIKITAGNAVYDQTSEQIDLSNSAFIEVNDPNGKRSSARSQNAVVRLYEPSPGLRSFQRAELSNDVEIAQFESDKNVTIRSGKAVYDRPSERFDVENGVVFESTKGQSKVSGTSAAGAYEVSARQVTLTGNARVEQGSDFAKADRIVAILYPQNALERVDAIGNGEFQQVNPDSKVVIVSPNINAAFAEDGTMVRSNAFGPSEISRNTNDGNRFVIGAAKSVSAVFKGRGKVDLANTDGRTTIRLDVPDNGSDSANKSITADTVNTKFQADGKNFQHTEAIGDVVFTVTPHRSSIQNYKTQIEAPRFNCDFFSGVNNPSVCNASSNTKVTRTPTLQREGRGDQIIEADKLTAHFDERTANIVQLDANGKARFTELDRRALAATFSFTASDEVVRIRGGEPTAWDSRARIKAREIDWDTRNDRSVYRNGVHSTYYSAKGMKGSAPFGEENKPVYFTADTFELDHKNESGVYIGNARGWQGNNYVRGARIDLSQRESRMTASGGVQSLLYQLKTKNETRTNVPVFAAANEMLYDGATRTIKYLRDVDIRQGQDRISGASATVYLDERNELVRTEAEAGVAIIQSGRKAFADLAIYTAVDDKLYLRGRPARVDDSQNGTSEGEELNIYLNDNRVSGEGKSKVNPSGRMRSSYKVN